MIIESVRIILFVFAGLVAVAAAQEPEFYLRTGDDVIFLRDSETTSWTYEGLIESYVLTRFPAQPYAGFSHWLRNLKPYPPSTARTTVVVLAVDTEVREGADGKTRERRFLSEVNDSLPRARVTVLRIGPSQAGDSTAAIDLAGSIRATNPAACANDPELAAALRPNGGLAGDEGQLLVALAVLQAWHAPGLVSEVEVNALRGTVIRSENTRVRDLEDGRVIAWSQDDRTLPLPLDITAPAVQLAGRCTGLLAALDQQTLRIRGLAATQYRFTIDGEFQGIFHRDQLDAGINLAEMHTPMWKQAMEVHAMTRKHTDLRASRRRLYQVPEEQRRSAEWHSALEALDVAEAELVKEQLARATPRTHDYELQPVER